MREIDLANYRDKEYILLGVPEIETEPFYTNKVLPKVNKDILTSVPGLWGTLAPLDAKGLNWEGTLKISNNGNDSSQGATLDEIRQIYITNPQLDNKEFKVTERFISFESVKFNFPAEFKINEIPKFRLTLYLEPSEGALVYYEFQHSKTIGDPAAAINYIQPQSTGAAHAVNSRDRLTYIFDALPPRKLIRNANSNENSIVLSKEKCEVKFLIKILTYYRGDFADSSEVIAKQVSLVSGLFEKKQQLLLYKPAKQGSFVEANGSNINYNLKTLLLIHGTFATTDKSFEALVKSKWLDDVIAQKKFEQVIAYDHPTVFKDAHNNVTALLNFFGTNTFKFPVSIIGSSQGGLLAQYLANLKPPKPFEVAKVALVASANGVKWVEIAADFNKFLSILKVINKDFPPALQLITALAQHSVAFCIKQPGLDLMSPGSQRLKDILDSKPSSKSTLYLPIIDDFTKRVVVGDNFFKKIRKLGLDIVISAFLGKHNDWVVQSQNQFLVPKEYCVIEGYNPENYRKYIYPSVHGKCLDRKDVRKKLMSFFKD